MTTSTTGVILPFGRQHDSRPVDRRTQAQQWADAVQTLTDLLDHFQKWQDDLPASLENSATAEALDAALELRAYVEELQDIDLSERLRTGLTSHSRGTTEARGDGSCAPPWPST